MRRDLDPDSLRRILCGRFPDLSGASFTLSTVGWDSVAVDVDNRLIFKFPRHIAAEAALRREAALLAVIRPAVTIPVPDLVIHPGPPLFSRHEKLPGQHLVTAEYERLAPGARDRLANDLARFYAELHALDPATVAAAGAGPVEAWPNAEAMRHDLRPVLPPALRDHAERTLSAWERLPPDPHGTVYGFFDGHGWNMAFDHERGRLNGIYDFADSGFGPLQQEFIYSNFISRDLTARIIAKYEGLTGRAIDRERVELLSGVLRLSELAAHVDDPHHAPAMLQFLKEWAEG